MDQELKERYESYQEAIGRTIDQFGCCKHPVIQPIYAALVLLRRYCNQKALDDKGIPREITSFVKDTIQSDHTVSFTKRAAGGKSSTTVVVGKDKIYIRHKVNSDVVYFSKNTNGGKLSTCNTSSSTYLSDTYPKTFITVEPDSFFSTAKHFEPSDRFTNEPVSPPPAPENAPVLQAAKPVR